MSLTIEVVPYHPDLAPYFLQLNLAWISKYFKVEAKDLRQLNSPDKILDDGGQIFFCQTVEKPKSIIGCCAVIREDQETFEIAKMAIIAKHQGKGFSHPLMEACEKWAKDKGATKMVILTNSDLSSALNLYKKHGYQAVPTNGIISPDYARCDLKLEKNLK